MIRTGFNSIDEMLGGGLREGYLYLFGGRPGMGKTAFALSVIDNVCVKEHEPCAYFSMDYPKERLEDRLAQIHSRTHWYPRCEEKDIPKKKMAMEELKDIPLWSVSAEYMTVSEIAEHSRGMNDGHLSLLIVDWIQHISKKKGLAANKEIASGLKDLKQLSMDMNCPILILSQLTRRLERRRDKRPQKGDFRNIIRPEKYVDEIMMLYRDGYYKNNYYSGDASDNCRKAEIRCIHCKDMSSSASELVFNHDVACFEQI